MLLRKTFQRLLAVGSLLATSLQLTAHVNTGRLPREAVCRSRRFARQRTSRSLTTCWCLTDSRCGLFYYGYRGKETEARSYVPVNSRSTSAGKTQGWCIPCNTRHNFTGDLSCFKAICENTSVWQEEYKGRLLVATLYIRISARALTGAEEGTEKSLVPWLKWS